MLHLEELYRTLSRGWPVPSGGEEVRREDLHIPGEDDQVGAGLADHLRLGRLPGRPGPEQAPATPSGYRVTGTSPTPPK